jgi:hypothetical protein
MSVLPLAIHPTDALDFGKTTRQRFSDFFIRGSHPLLRGASTRYPQSWLTALPQRLSLYVSSTSTYYDFSTNVSAKPIEATLMALALLLASGRLVPRLVQRQYPTLSDSLLIASILDIIGLFVTDYLTYIWGGMTDDAEASTARVIALKKVSRQLGPVHQAKELTMKGAICRQCILRHWHLLAKAGNPRVVFQTYSTNDAMVAKSTLRSDVVHWQCHDIDALSRYFLVRAPGLSKLVP